MSRNEIGRRLLLVALGAVVGAGVAWACGPDFPSQLLADRSATLMATPNNGFAYEGAHLVVPEHALRASEPDPYNDDAWRAKVAAAENAGLDAAQLKLLAAAASLDGDDAYRSLADLPEAIRRYAAGAADYHGGARCAAAKAQEQAAEQHAPYGAAPAATPACVPDAAQLDRAVARFEAVLALPPAQRKAREMDAAYMLARIAQQRFTACASCQADAGAAARQRLALVQQYAELRQRALAGAPDPQGLAVASFGDEARLYLHVSKGAGDVDGGMYCRWQDFIVHAECPARIAAEDYRQAIALYAQQAAHDSRGGLDSLRLLAGDLLGRPALVQTLVHDPLAQRLLTAYALADGASDPVDAQDRSVATHLQTLADALQQPELAVAANADRLAALAYRAGRYAMAAGFAQHSDSPLAWWVRAKLAVRKGDMAAAAADYAHAIKAFPQQATGQASLSPANTHLLVGEDGVLALARGEYVEAMQRLYAAAKAVGGDGNDYDTGPGYGYDVSYLAERVLGTDELKAFVDANAPAAHAPGKLATNLRWLLARRLMRDGRYPEAMAYFPPAGSKSADGEDLPRLAGDYAAALHAAHHAWTAIGRAQAWYRAAAITRGHGMELFGYEQSPDYRFADGSYSFGPGLDAKQLKQRYVSTGEQSRYAQTAARPDLRFHYRYLAADDASRAADLLPPRSQAFAAVLCHATDWMLQGPPDYNDHFAYPGEPQPTILPQRKQRAAALYARYVKQGAHVPWAAHFGRQCPAPDFAEARSLQRRERIAAVRHWLGRERWPLAGAGMLLLAALAGWRWLRRGDKAHGRI